VRLAVVPKSVRLDREPDETVALSAEGIWDEERWFDYGDGPGTCSCERRFREKIRLASAPASFSTDGAGRTLGSWQRFRPCSGTAPSQ